MESSYDNRGLQTDFMVLRRDVDRACMNLVTISTFFSRKLKMTQLVRLINSLARDEEGAALVEYGLLVALIAVACVAAATLLGNNISLLFNNLAGKLL